jgi:hypothetical protein
VFDDLTIDLSVLADALCLCGTDSCMCRPTIDCFLTNEEQSVLAWWSASMVERGVG